MLCLLYVVSRCRVVALWRCGVVALSRCAFCNVWCVVCGVHMHVYVERECAKRATEAAAAAEAETEGSDFLVLRSNAYMQHAFYNVHRSSCRCRQRCLQGFGIDPSRSLGHPFLRSWLGTSHPCCRLALGGYPEWCVGASRGEC